MKKIETILLILFCIILLLSIEYLSIGIQLMLNISYNIYFIQKCPIIHNNNNNNNNNSVVIVYTKYKVNNNQWLPNDKWIQQELIEFKKVIYFAYNLKNNQYKLKQQYASITDNYNQHCYMSCIVNNKGKEAIGYLTFIYQYYNSLPKHVIFIHGHKNSWHNNNRDIVQQIKKLNFSNINYSSLNENFCNQHKSILSIKNDNNNNNNDNNNDDISRILTRYWNETIGKHLLITLPNVISYHCCAQFVVSRERIHIRKRKFYKEMINWLNKTNATDYDSSRVFEYTWHLIFGERIDFTCTK